MSSEEVAPAGTADLTKAACIDHLLYTMFVCVVVVKCADFGFMVSCGRLPTAPVQATNYSSVLPCPRLENDSLNRRRLCLLAVARMGRFP